MNTHHLALLLLATLLPAQEGTRQVPPGREVRQHKLLSFNATDTWKLEVHKGEILHCRVSSAAFDPVLTLADSAGKVLAEVDGHGTHSELYLRMPATGSVQFEVRGQENRGGGRYDLHLWRYRTQDLAAETRVSHRFGKERWWHYHLELRKGQILVPDIRGAGRITLVFDMDRNGLSAQTGGYAIPRDGSYFVRVEGQHEHEVSFAYTLSRQVQLPENGKVREQLTPRQMVVWRRQLKAGEAWHFHMCVDGSQPHFDVWSPTPGHGPAFVWTGRLSKGGSQHSWLLVRRDCELQFRIHNHHAHGPTEYELCVDQPGLPVATGAQLEGQLPLGGAVLFRLDTRPGELLRVTAQSTAFDGQLDLWLPDGHIPLKNDDRGTLDRNPELRFLVTRPGTHRILLFSPGGYASGPFRLEVESLPIPALQLGGELEIELTHRGTQYVHLELAQGQEVWLNARSARCDPELTVERPDGKRMGTWGGGDIGHNALAPIRAPQSGRYTIHVHSRDRAGSCRLRAIRP